MAADREHELRHGRHRAVIGELGASLRRLELGGAPAIWGYAGAEARQAGQGDVLLPWAGRIAGGEYTFRGARYQLERNDKEGPNAIHGFVRGIPWTVIERTEASVELAVELGAREYGPRGYPFSLRTTLRYGLSDQGLECSFHATNTGSAPAPFGVGFHPYFTVGTAGIADAEALIPAAEIIEFGPGFIPTGRVIPVPAELDFRAARRIGETRLNTCYTALQRGADGMARARLRNPATGRALELWMDPAFPYLVAYTGDAIPAPHGRASLALEPMTLGTDAFNRPEWGLRELAPGQSAQGRYGVKQLG
jgi:aldose 1-epimerase